MVKIFIFMKNVLMSILNISKCTSKKLEWVNKSDEDILNKVESLVDSRIKESKINKIAALSGILIFGDVESSREFKRRTNKKWN